MIFINWIRSKFLYKKVILNESECKFIVNYILENENKIKNLGPDIYGGTGEDSLTGRYPYFNYLNVPEINLIIVPKLKKIFSKLQLEYPIYIQCWANTYRYGDFIKPHKHSDCGSFISANLFLQGDICPGTSYYFNNKVENEKIIKNKLGEFISFKSDLLHSVKPYNGKDVRITMAFDIHSRKSIISENLCDLKLNKNRFYKLK